LALTLSMYTLIFTAGERVTAHAEESQDAREELEGNIDALLNALDLKELQDYLDTLSEFGGISVKDKLKSVITGDFALDYSSLGQSVLALVWDEASVLLPAFAVILAVSLLCGILNSAKNGFLDSTMSDIIEFVGFISVGAVILSCLVSVLSAGFTAITQMKRQMEIVYPILLTLMAASGGAVSAAVYRPAVAFMSGAIAELFTAVILPSAVVVIVLAFVGSLSSDYKTEKLSDLFKSVSKWLLGLTLGLFSIFLSVQGIAAAQYDGLSLRAAKYALSSSVPLVGGFLSGGADIVLAGSALIKNALGSFSIFILFGTILRPLLLFAAFQLFLRLAAAATEPVGGKVSGFLSRLAKDMSYFIAALLCVAFLYFLTLLLLICSSGVIF
ncbi:MAG: stage III sporulation protein AE, partial [Clostridiales bacterium]|nr:stage III sporulation protein AE [Clostridiales bacterium]